MMRTISVLSLSAMVVVVFIGCSATDSPKSVSNSSGEAMMKEVNMMADDGMKMSTMKNDKMMKDDKMVKDAAKD
jgi:alkaline phosphatase